MKDKLSIKINLRDDTEYPEVIGDTYDRGLNKEKLLQLIEEIQGTPVKQIFPSNQHFSSRIPCPFSEMQFLDLPPLAPSIESYFEVIDSLEEAMRASVGIPGELLHSAPFHRIADVVERDKQRVISSLFNSHYYSDDRFIGWDQVRFPKSKKKRIQKKWRRDPNNYIRVYKM